MALNPEIKNWVIAVKPQYADQLDSLSDIPGFDSSMATGWDLVTGYYSGNNDSNMRGAGLRILDSGLKMASTDPVAFVKSAMKDSVYKDQTDLLKSQIQYLQTKNVPLDDIKARYTEIATQKAQGEADYAAARANLNQGGGGLFGDIGKFFASIDPSAAISRAATNLFQPVEQTVSKELAQLDKDLSLSQNAPLLAAMAVSVAMPGVGSAIGQQMIAAGLIPATTSAAVATAIGTGVANAALQVAQGKSAEDALKGAVVGGVAGFAGGQVGDYLVADPGAVKSFVSSTAANMAAGKDPETAAKTALVQTGIQGTADLISTAQAEKYLEKLPIPDYLNVTTPPTSADVIAAFPETNPNLVEVSQPNLTSNEIDAALKNLTGGYTLGGTTEGIKATMPDTVVTGTEPIDYTLNTITGGEGLTLPTSPNLESMGGGQGLTTAVTGGVLSEAGLTPTGNVTLGDATSFINTGAPVTTNQTYTYDDGSTITVDKDGNIVGYTDATDTPYTGTVETPSSPLTKSQVEGIIKLGLSIYGASQVADAVRDAISSGDAETPQDGFPFTPSDISGWARPEYTKTWQAPLDLNSLFTTDNLLGGTQWAGLQGNQFANIPQVSMSDFISSIQNGKV